MSALSSISRQAVQAATRGVRGIHTSVPKQGGAGDPHYIHAENMYEIWNMKGRPAKFGFWIVTCVVSGLGLPVVACTYSHSKSSG